jgi:ribosomal-protein-alanine N-acetyltransferase
MGGDAWALAGDGVSIAASNPVVIRHGGRSDLASLVAIERASFSDPWSVESFASALTMDRMRVLVAEERDRGEGGGDRTLLGYVLALVLGQEAEIADLAVAPSARRRGVAKLLIGRILEDLEARGVASVFLEVRESNVAARALYGSSDFVAVGRRTGYYRNPTEDALLLKRDIAPT